MADMGSKVKQAKVLTGASDYPTTNSPYARARGKQYLAGATQRFVQDIAQYASDYFTGECQGIAEDFYEYVPCKVRLSDLVPRSTSADRTDDWKTALWDNANVDYVALGAKLSLGEGTDNQTYIVTNPSNASSATATAIVRRCNAVWKYLDFYGNIKAEPFCWNKGAALSTADWTSEYMTNAQSYNHSVMQKNGTPIYNNYRVILGSSAWFVRGLVDFLLEFTGNDETHIMYFDLERTEPTADDDIVNGVANALSFAWDIAVSGTPVMGVGARQQLVATSTRNGVVVADTLEYPVSYTWSISDPSVATIEADGTVNAISQGQAVATATLAQNGTKVGSFTIDVEDAPTGSFAAFENAPQTATVYTDAVFTAQHIVNGIPTGDTAIWTIQGDGSLFSANPQGNALTISCYAAGEISITVTYGEDTASTTLTIEGY